MQILRLMQVRLPLQFPNSCLRGFLFICLWWIAASQTAFAQSRTVNGQVTDQTDNTPLPGVNVLVKGASTGTATDPEGRFSLTVPGNETVLVFSFIGFTPQEVPVGNRTSFNVTLAPDVTALNEVVVVGYGTQRREDLTGAVSTVTAKDFVTGNVVTPEQLVVGKVAGLQVTPSGGAPGAGSRIRIRGGASLNASNDPLIVIDGIPLDNNQIAGAANPLSMINPNDIESFNVLKDASATAIYGSRASNGVIIITTKKGRKGDKLGVNFNTLGSLSQVRRKIEVLSAGEFRGIVGQQGTSEVRALLGQANTRWQDQIYRNALSTDNNLNISGAYKFLPYRVSLGYLDQGGILKTSNLQRTSGSLSLSPSFLKDHLKVNLNLRGAITNSRFGDEGAIGASVFFDPTQPVRIDGENNLGGYFEWTDNQGNPLRLAPRNPLSLLEQNNNRGQSRRSIGNLQFDYKFHFLPALRANLNIGYDYSNSDGSRTRPVTAASVFAQGGEITRFEQTRQNRLLDFYLNYNQEIAAIRSKVEAQAGYSYQDFLTEEPLLPRTNINGDIQPGPTIPKFRNNTLIGIFGRLNYSLMDRYLLTATIRTDGSSRFAPGQRWATFPSVALGWRIKGEEFLKDNAFVSDLKLRASVGVTGQQDIGQDFQYLPVYSVSDPTATYPFGGQYIPLYSPRGYDINLKWEETTAWNFGLDFGFLNDRINGSLEYYTRNTRDLLSQVPLAIGTNFTNEIISNVGDMKSNGFEATVNFNVLNTDRLNWTAGVNGTYNNFRITRLSLTGEESAGVQVGGIQGGTGNNIQIHTAGYSPNAFYVYQQVYDPSGRPIEGLYVDRNRDGVVSSQDRYRYKDPNADVYFGFNTNLTYDKWSFGAVLRGSLGNYVYNNVYSNAATLANIRTEGYVNNLSRNFLQTGFTGRDPERYFSDYFVQNASFLRLENINAGYNVGQIFKDKASLRLTANILNAFVITRYKGIDPEVTTTTYTDNNPQVSSGIDNNFYPRPRIYSLGLNIGF